MHLAPSMNKPSSPYASHHVVSPSKLFAIAEIRFDAALRVLGSDDSLRAPSALMTSIALREARNGVSALRSVLAPSTPWTARQTASNAMLHATDALVRLERYSATMAPRGDGPFHRDDLGAGTLALLDTARAALGHAANVLP